MPSDTSRPITSLLDAANEGDETARNELLKLVYTELRAKAAARIAQERSGNELQPTSLVHDAFLRALPSLRYGRGREFFFDVVARAMRQIVTEHARHVKSLRRGREYKRIPWDDAVDYLEAEVNCRFSLLPDALEALATFDRRGHTVVMLRSAGHTNAEIAEFLEVSERTIERDLRFAYAWLRSELEDDK